MSENNKAVVRAWFEESDRQKTLPIEYCAPEFAAYYPGNPTLDLAAFQPHLESFYRAFPDLTQTVEEVISEDDRVGFRVTSRGTHTGDFNGMPPSGERISVVQVGIARVVNGKIVEIWNNPDRLGLMQQIGVLPPPQAVSEQEVAH